jgi:MFS family permease
VLLVLCGTVFLEGIDVAILTVAVPAIRADLGLSGAASAAAAMLLAYGIVRLETAWKEGAPLGK